jgi:sigma-B regulation protein RsbU (phosphoserine phosphatase)
MTLEQLLESGNVPTKADLSEEDLARLFRKYRGLQKKHERDQAFWAATNENLKTAYERLDEQERELARTYQIIRDDLAVASRIQQALLPHLSDKMAAELELAVHHKQLTEVGGDYYDFFTTASGNSAVGVFDISGHGVSAALVMTYLKAKFVTALEEHDSPKVIVESINGNAYEFLKTVKKYATVNFVVIGTAAIRYVCGGGFGLLVKGSKGTAFAKRDSFLGLRRQSFREHELPFGEGDVLALYTDGIPEAQNQQGEDYTVRRLNDLIVKNAKRPVQEILDRCLEDYTGFRGKDSDDVTLVVLRKKV